MPSKNVDTFRAAHDSWNKRDFAGIIRNAAENFVYTDHAQNRTMNGREKFREWAESWVQAFSDGRVVKPEYIDGGDVVVALFTAEGTNNGSLGPLKPTGRKISLPFCEIVRFDKQGKMIGGSCYYDQYALLTQLGHLQNLMAAA